MVLPVSVPQRRKGCGLAARFWEPLDIGDFCYRPDVYADVFAGLSDARCLCFSSYCAGRELVHQHPHEGMATGHAPGVGSR